MRQRSAGTGREGEAPAAVAALARMAALLGPVAEATAAVRAVKVKDRCHPPRPEAPEGIEAARRGGPRNQHQDPQQGVSHRMPELYAMRRGRANKIRGERRDTRQRRADAAPLTLGFLVRLIRAASEMGAAATVAREWTAQGRERIRQHNARLGLAKHLVLDYTGPLWKAGELALLGTASDHEVARRTGRSVAGVRKKRWKLGIANSRDGRLTIKRRRGPRTERGGG